MPENGNVAINKKEIALSDWRPQTLRPVIEAEGIQIYSSLHSYRNILFKHLWLIFVVAFALTAVMAIYSVMTKPEYRATARILVEPENQEFQTVNDLFHSSAPNDDTFLATQADVLQSDNLAWETIQQLQLPQAPEFARYLKGNGALDSSAAIQAKLIETFKKQLTVERRRDTRMMLVSFDSRDAHLASVIVNALIRNYIEYNFRMRYDATRRTTEWMAKQLDELKKKVETSQQALVDYEERNSIVGVGGKESVAEQRLADLSRDLTEAQKDRMEKELVLQLVTPSKLADSGSAVPASTAAQPSEAIERVRLGQNGERTEVDVTGTGQLNYHVLRLSQPDRVVLDFAGAHLKVSDKDIASNLDPVRKVRVAQFSPEVARVVIDLRETTPYSVSTNGNTVKVEFRPVKTSQVEAPTAPEAQDLTIVTTKEAPERDEPVPGFPTTKKDSAPALPSDVTERSRSSEVSAIAQNTVLQKLEERDADLREQYVEAVAQYGEAFPKVVRLRGQIDEVQALIERERKRTIARLSNDFDGSKKREALLTGAVVQQKAEVGKFNRLSIQQNMLQREFETNRQLYDTLLQRLKDASVTAGLRATNIHLVDEAKPLPSPVRPRKLRNLATGLLAGLILGFLLAMTREALDNSIKSAVEVEMLVEAPALAIIPYQNGLRAPAHVYRYLGSIAEAKRTAEDDKELSPFKKRLMLKVKNERVELSVLHNPGSPISEAFRALRTSILLSTAELAPQAILVTSAQPAEGRTCVSINLAVTLAQKGCRVLLVDADFRRPGIAAQLGLSKQVGLSNALEGPPNVEGSLRQLDPLKNLWVLPSGACPCNPTELLSSPRMDYLLGTMREKFDQIIFDSPSVLKFTDAAILSSMVDGVVIVVENEKTGRDALLRACRVLTNSGGRILGAVLNKVDVGRDGYYGHCYDKGDYGSYKYCSQEAHTDGHQASRPRAPGGQFFEGT